MMNYQDFTCFQIRNYRLLMTACCMYFHELIKRQKRSQTRQQIIWELANIVEDVWNKGHCCPYTRKHIVTLSEKNVLDKYIYIYIYINFFSFFLLQIFYMIFYSSYVSICKDLQKTIFHQALFRIQCICNL